VRTLIRITPDIDKGNEAILNGRFEKLLSDTAARLRPEASFFFADHGRRTANFICDMTDQSDMPAIAEPWFVETNATVEFLPCMNVDDVRAGLQKAMDNMAQTIRA
jgi:hypothetical protein